MVSFLNLVIVIIPDLSVLALSSRFDGLDAILSAHPRLPTFQYSLCRVVLMVLQQRRLFMVAGSLSVLALSSRFDGPTCARGTGNQAASFSTRSVESF